MSERLTHAHIRLPSGLPIVFSIFVVFLSADATRAQLVEFDDPSLPASADGFNLSRDLDTGLEWLDLDVSAGRSYSDLIGEDGTDEFAPDGDFPGFRHATFHELTGWTASGQQPSLFSHFGFASQFGSTGGYAPVREFLTWVGCFGSCATWGFASGLYVADDQLPATLRWAKIEAFQSQGASFGGVSVNFPAPPTSTTVNGTSTTHGHFLVRTVPEPGLACALVAGAILLAAWAPPRR